MSKISLTGLISGIFTNQVETFGNKKQIRESKNIMISGIKFYLYTTTDSELKIVFIALTSREWDKMQNKNTKQAVVNEIQSKFDTKFGKDFCYYVPDDHISGLVFKVVKEKLNNIFYSMFD